MIETKEGLMRKEMICMVVMLTLVAGGCLTQGIRRDEWGHLRNLGQTSIQNGQTNMLLLLKTEKPCILPPSEKEKRLSAQAQLCIMFIFKLSPRYGE